MKTFLDFFLYIRLQLGCFAILLYIAFSFFSVKRRNTYVHKLFSVIILSSIFNLICDMATVYTVNHLDTVPPVLNHILHILFVGSTAMVVFCTYLYVRSLVYPEIEHPLGRPMSWIPFLLSILCILFLPIRYDRAPHTNYSAGLAVTSAYACIIFYFVRCFMLLIKFRKNVNKKQIRAIVTAILTILIVTSIQAFVSESLISSIGIVLLNIAFFFTVENPDATLIEELAYEKDRANEANQAKSNFLANMSHEIRTPINAVLGMDEMILRESSNPQIRQYAANIKHAGSTLLDLINEILDFSKIEAGKMELLPEPYETSSMIVDLVNMISERAEEKNLTFVMNANPKLPKTLYGDCIRLKQCILNLLTNAVKYTQSGSVTFNIDFIKSNNKSIILKISVKDTGVGIKEKDMERLFAPFERLEENKYKTIEGTGLGMTIVQKILQLHNSSLQVKSVYGKGSEFFFDLKQDVINWDEVGNINESYKKIVEELSSYNKKIYAPDAKILVVDDTEMNLEVVTNLLKSTGIQVDTALSGPKALEMVKYNRYDILFIDHRMPDMDGIQTFHEMQNMNENLSSGKPCIALTANAISGAKKMYLDEGFTDYISKPINPEKLEILIRKYLPKELIQENIESEVKNITKIESNKPDSSQIMNIIRSIDGINSAVLIENCRDPLLANKALKMFYNSIDQNSEELHNLLNAEDLKLYCVKVHALKSNARLIGASELAKQAEFLEHSSAENDLQTVKDHHNSMIYYLKSYKEKLAPIISQE
ncbi:MAG: response regulator [Treponema sp.]|nr:response regulator [Treponema sp.]